MHVVVVGAGVIGLSSALYLARAGLEVTLVERNQDVALETSFANGGQLSYNNVAPLADPSVLGHLPRWLLSREAPLHLRPRLDPRQWRWCLAFLRACRASRVEQTFGEMVSLSLRSQTLMTELLQHTPIDFDLRHSGKLIIHRSAASLSAAARLLERQQSAGARHQVLSASECTVLEPALAAVTERLAGGIFTPGDAVGNCRLFCEGVKRQLQGMRNVRLHLGEAVSGFERRGSRLAALRLGEDRLPAADGFVIACGIASVPLVKPLGIDLPLYPLRGYTLSVQPNENLSLPKISITDASRKILYAPLGDSLRIAAMVDLGARTALWLNVGHGPLGFTLACASGEGLARLIAQAPPPVDLAPFSLAAHGAGKPMQSTRQGVE